MKQNDYQTIIIGGGAAGLFAGATHRINPAKGRGVILEAGPVPGRKLLITGGGQCNLTHGGPIREFIPHYGRQGGQIRSVLYHCSNQRVMAWFRQNGLPLLEREDGKVFPESMRAADVRDVLLMRCRQNGWEIRCGERVESLEEESCGAGQSPVRWRVNGRWTAHRMLVCTGGRSYPETGSDGSMFPLLRCLGLKLVRQEPALTPVFVQGYPFADLAGISFPNVLIRRLSAERVVVQEEGALLLTHRNFSGPAVLRLSRELQPGDKIEIVFYRGDVPDCRGISRSLVHALADRMNLPERFLERVLEKEGADLYEKASRVSMGMVKSVFRQLSGMRFTVSGKAGYDQAMVTSGGVSLEEVNLHTMETKKHPGLFLAGEVLDVDGDTGGYNLQFAFSSADAAMSAMEQKR